MREVFEGIMDEAKINLQLLSRAGKKFMKIFEEIKKLVMKPMSGMLIVGCYATFLRLPAPNLHLNRHRKILEHLEGQKID